MFLKVWIPFALIILSLGKTHLCLISENTDYYLSFYSVFYKLKE